MKAKGTKGHRKDPSQGTNQDDNAQTNKILFEVWSVLFSGFPTIYCLKKAVRHQNPSKFFPI